MTPPPTEEQRAMVLAHEPWFTLLARDIRSGKARLILRGVVDGMPPLERAHPCRVSRSSDRPIHAAWVDLLGSRIAAGQIAGVATTCLAPELRGGEGEYFFAIGTAP